MARIGVVGVGRVGSTTAFALSRESYAERIVLIDPNQEQVLGVSLDIRQGTYFQSDADVRVGSYKDIQDLDFLVVTAGVKPHTEKGATRLSGMEDAYKIVKDIANNIQANGFEGDVIVASNPLDTMTYALTCLLGERKGKVIGTGCTLDTARYVTILADKLGIERKRIHGFVLGEHGDTSFPCFHSTTIDGIPLFDWMAKEKKGKECLDSIADEVRQAGYVIARRLGSTYYGIASAIDRILKARLSEEGEVLPVSMAIKEGPFSGIATSLPYHVSRKGVESAPIDLDADEKRALEFSCDAIRKTIDSLGMARKG